MMQDQDTLDIQLVSGDGTVTRKARNTPLRDALESEIPVIDVADIVHEDLAKRQAVADQIRAASVETGFFYIKNHGVPQEIISNTYEAMKQYFRQDTDTKMQVNSFDIPEQAYGYRPSKSQILNHQEGSDVREAFFWRHDADIEPGTDDVPQFFHDRLKPDAFIAQYGNSLPPEMTVALEQYSTKLFNLAKVLTRAFALSLDLDEAFFDSKFRYPESTVTVNYYPPVDQTGPADEQVSIGSHTDFLFFTILSQDDIGGLQVVNRQGEWVRVQPIQGTFVVNIADFLQRLTNDRYMSNIHRVRNYSGKERMSIPFFWGFGLDESCGVIPTCVADGQQPKYAVISCREWLDKRMQDMLKIDKTIF